MTPIETKETVETVETGEAAPAGAPREQGRSSTQMWMFAALAVGIVVVLVS